jgi:hypothetical protein
VASWVRRSRWSRKRRWRASTAIDFVVRREFDYQIPAFANGKPLEEIPGVSFRKNGGFAQPGRPGDRGSRFAALGHQGL